MASISKQIVALEKALKALKVIAKASEKSKKAPKKESKKESKKEPKKAPKVSKKSDKPEKIEDCKKKDDLKSFTKAQLIIWAKNNDCDIKDILKKLKDDLVNLVWKSLKLKVESYESDVDSDDSDSSLSDIDSDSDSDDEE